jgi:hypothetical protein
VEKKVPQKKRLSARFDTPKIKAKNRQKNKERNTENRVFKEKGKTQNPNIEWVRIMI